jgi:hypothetical protein
LPSQVVDIWQNVLIPESGKQLVAMMAIKLVVILRTKLAKRAEFDI